MATPDRTLMSNGWRSPQRYRSVLCACLCLCFILLGSLGIAVEGAIADAPPAVNAAPVVEPPGATTVQADDISSEKVSQFVSAYLQVLALLDQREGDLQAAETQVESVRLQQEIEAEALALIDTAGLTLQEYLQLLGLANTDPDFGENVATQLQESTQ